ncbi:MAG: DNA repair protein RecN [Candidatus Gastranaerophilales bacterium]|nr:DNA repair protein RecN [Candidatus Gastranaerophilales bacterium]
MLKSLTIKNFILLKEATLNFTKGFNVLCGETGAGKSIIIKALDSVLGAKINKEVILNKDLPCYIEATFENNGVETIISREISSQSKFRLNGILSSADEIKELRESLVDIHSQHQTYSYIQPKNHIYLLDNYIIKKSPEFFELLKSYKENYLEFKEIEKKLNALRENLENNEREIDFLQFQLKELDDAAIQENEEEELKEELNILSNTQELKEGSYSSYYALYGDNQSIVEALGKIKYTISSLAELDKNLIEANTALCDAFENLKETANYLRDYSSGLELNPMRLDELNERISLIQKLKRKYGTNLDEERDNIASKLELLTRSDNNIEILEENYNLLLSTLEMLSESISEYRKRFSNELSTLIVKKLKNLELKEAKFEIAIKEVSKNELGIDNVEFMISTNKNQGLAPLSRVASGGEISRVMLALKTIFALIDKVQTVVFDEIDTGISGITSSSVANSILELASMSQIICITHQPIICAKADNFIWITKTHDNDTNIKIEILDDLKRLEALAQLASGEITQETIDFAKTLVK